MANILIVDDSIIMRKNLKTLIISAGHTVVAEANNGFQALLEYEKHPIDIVTMDITMPVMNGIESVKRIVAKHPEAKIIIISALDQKNIVFQALESGAINYIIKPVTFEKVSKVINQVYDTNNINK